MRLLNAERISKNRRDYYKKNKDKEKNQHLEWLKKNKDVNVIYANRRRTKKNNNGGDHTLEEWNNLKKKYNYTCLCCGKKEPEIKLTIDHVVPLSKGGRNEIGNIQPLCKSCNSSKRTRSTDYRVLI
jgi:5-methylcytosine-specific restriction endonuclease McrA